MDYRFLTKAASTPAMAGARFTPLLYAVEVKQHPWAVALIRQAKQQFKLDAEKQFDVTYAPRDVTAKRNLEQQIARAAQCKMQGWLDTACGAGNPPAALVRSLSVYCVSFARPYVLTCSWNIVHAALVIFTLTGTCISFGYGSSQFASANQTFDDTACTPLLLSKG